MQLFWCFIFLIYDRDFKVHVQTTAVSATWSKFVAVLKKEPKGQPVVLT